MQIKKRALDLKLPAKRSAFLWGPRKVGKTYWLTHELKPEVLIDFLETDTFAAYASRPSLLRQRYLDHRGLVVIDEVQKIPAILDEVQWLMTHRDVSFLLTGSSARKLRRGHANLLGGRAWRRTMVPLSFVEVGGFDLARVMVSGMLPPHFLSPDPVEDLRAYVADYLKEEIAAEALTQNIPAFADFLRVAAISSGELINYVNMGRETGVSHRVVRTYFGILEDTLLGFRVAPWRKSRTRRMVLTEKFYLFDVGVANYLARCSPQPGSMEFGKAFEHFILMEIKAYQAYRKPDLPITFWRASSGQEVDFVLGDKDAVIEVKSSDRVHEGDLRGLKALLEDGAVKNCLVVCAEPQPRKVEKNIQILPWKDFLERLWAGSYS